MSVSLFPSAASRVLISIKGLKVDTVATTPNDHRVQSCNIPLAAGGVTTLSASHGTSHTQEVPRGQTTGCEKPSSHAPAGVPGGGSDPASGNSLCLLLGVVCDDPSLVAECAALTHVAAVWTFLQRSTYP